MSNFLLEYSTVYLSFVPRKSNQTSTELRLEYWFRFGQHSAFQKSISTVAYPVPNQATIAKDTTRETRITWRIIVYRRLPRVWFNRPGKKQKPPWGLPRASLIRSDISTQSKRPPSLQIINSSTILQTPSSVALRGQCGRELRKTKEIELGEAQKADKAISDTRKDTTLVRGAQWMQDREKTLKNKKRLTK